MGYAQIVAPMTNLLMKKDSFIQTGEATTCFERLKRAMVTTPILGFPNFDKEFTVETDASNFGMGAVLIQENHPYHFTVANYLVG